MDRPPRSDIGRASAPPKTTLQRKSYATAGNPNNSQGLDRLSAVQGPTLGRKSLAKTAEQLERRSVYIPKVSLSIMLLDRASGDPVAYKNDGTRFRHSSVTIKMASGGTYTLRLSMKPEVVIEEDSVFLTVRFDGNIRDTVIDLEKGEADRYAKGNWKCDFPPSKNGTRITATLSGKMRDFGRFEVPLMMKVYSYNNKRLNQGTSLKQVGFDLKRIEGNEKNASYIQLGRMSYT